MIKNKISTAFRRSTALSSHFRPLMAGGVVSLCLYGNVAYAQATPDAGALLRDYEKNTAPTLEPAKPAEVSGTAPAQEIARVGTKVKVRSFNISSKQFTEATLREVVKEYVGKELTLAELQQAALKISDYYRQQGFLARAYLPQQKIQNGVVNIAVLEGSLTNIIVDPKSSTRLDNDIAVGIIADRMPVGQVLRSDNLQEGIRILNEIPGVTATAALESGSAEGGTVAMVSLSDAPRVNGMAQIDNGGVRSVGTTRIIGTASVNNNFGIGDQLSAIVAGTEGSRYGRVAFTAPVGYSGLALGLNASTMRYTVDKSFNPVDQAGFAYTLGSTATYPIMRHPNMSLTAQGTYDFKRLQNSVLDLNVTNKEIHVGQANLNGVMSDQWLGGGINNFNIGATIGNVDLSRNAGSFAVDSATAQTDGMYGKLNASISRLQKITDKINFYLSGQGQLAADNLDSSEQMSLGGSDGIRAYPTNEGYGDNGVLFHAELRHMLRDEVQLFTFYDAGWVQQHANPWAGWNAGSGQPNDYWLQGIGVGASWLPTSFTRFKATGSHTLGGNAGKALNGDNSDGRDNDMRLLVEASVLF